MLPKNIRYQAYWTDLHAAVDSSNADAVLFLLSKGAEVNSPSQAEEHHWNPRRVEEILSYSACC